jgi:hypothetical protein
MSQIKEVFLMNPLAVPGCQLWMDATDVAGNGTFFPNGTTVSSWKDKSGNGNIATTGKGNPTLLTKAINTQNALSFGSTQNLYMEPMLNIPSDDTVSIFIVATLNNDTENIFGRIVSFGNTADGTNNFDYQTVGNFTICRNYNTGEIGIYRNNSNITISVGYNTPFLIEAVFDGTNCDAYLNGTWFNSFASSGNFSFDRLGLGVNIDTKSTPNDCYPGTIGEVVLFYTNLSTNERQTIEGYLAWKWGLVAKLPSEHPYKINPQYAGPPFPNVSRVLNMTNTGAFNPLAIAGCQLWIDAADPAGSVLSGTTVTQLRDKSGNGYNSALVTGTVTYQATSFNGLPTFYLNGTGGFRGPTSITGSTLTAFCVGNADVTSGFNTRFFALGTPTLTSYQNSTTCEPFLRSGSGTENIRSYRNNTYQSAASYILGTNFIATAMYTGASNIMYLNGTGQTPVASSGSFAISQYGFGCEAKNGNAAMTGLISEIILYDSALTTEEQQQVERYLAWKWGLVTNLSPNNVPLFPFPYFIKPFSGRLIPY